MTTERSEYMSILNKLASFQGRRDDIPNRELAIELVAKQDTASIRQIAENLWNKDKNIQSDCLKVLYEIGYLNPALIADYADDFLKLLKSKNNRLVWGSMIALSTFAELRTEVLYGHWEEIQQVMEAGSVITVDAGVKTLAAIAAGSGKYRKKIFPHLLEHLAACRPKDVPQHAEQVLVAVDEKNKGEFIRVVEKRP